MKGVQTCGKPYFLCEKGVNSSENQGNMYLWAMKPSIKLPIEDFDYHLPDQSIAYTPASNRSDSKLLVWNKEIIAESTYNHIAKFIPEKAALYFNNSKVIAARIHFQKANNSTIEIFCLEPSNNYQPISMAMQASQKVEWICLVGGAKKWKEDVLIKELVINEEHILFYAKKINQVDGKFIIEFSWNHPTITFSEILSVIGNIPLPPYIQRKANEEDKDRYQTTYAIEEGSVAAPTAGLHFSEEVFASLADKNIIQKYLTLHVGAGTFMPVKADTIDEHDMHAEFIEVDIQLIEYLKENTGIENKPIVAVGTTSLRTIESVYWLGVKALIHKQRNENALPLNDLQLGQWEAYELAEHNFTIKETMNALLNYLNSKGTEKLIAKTQLMVTPGYQFKVCNALITNFHQPKSTLLLIIAAITGDHWKNIYQHAIENKYRFLSYCDGCFFKFSTLKEDSLRW